MSNYLQVIFGISAALAPCLVFLNTVPIIVLIRMKEAKKYCALISLFVTDLIMFGCNFHLFLKLGLLEPNNPAAIYSTGAPWLSLPLYLSFGLHILFLNCSQIYVISRQYISTLERKRLVNNLAIIDVMLWIIPLLSFAFYLKYSPVDVMVFSFKFLMPAGNSVLFVVITTSYCYIIWKVHQSEIRLKKTQGHLPQNMTTRQSKVLKMYLILVANFLIFVVIPFTVISIAYNRAEDGRVSTKLAVGITAFIQFWGIACPLSFFCTYFVKTFHEIFSKVWQWSRSASNQSDVSSGQMPDIATSLPGNHKVKQTAEQDVGG